MAAGLPDPWLALSRHFSYVGEHLRLDASLLRRLVEVDIVTGDEYAVLMNEATSRSRRMDRLLTDILPKRGPGLFDTFCKILTEVQQGFIAQRMKETLWESLESPARDQRIAEETLPSATAAPQAEQMPQFPSVPVDVESDGDPWLAITTNYVYLSQRLHFNDVFLGCLFEKRLISRGDFETLCSDSVTRAHKVHLLLMDILHSKPPAKFSVFCDILRCVGQSHLADRLTRNPVEVKLLPRGSCGRRKTSSFQRQVELLMVQVTDLDREKREVVRRAREVVRQERQRADAAEAETQRANVRAGKKRRRADIAEAQTEKEKKKKRREKMEKRGEQLTNLSLRYEISKCGAHHQRDDTLATWRQWNIEVPFWLQRGRLSEMESRLVAGGVGGKLHVLTDEGDEWETFVRKNGDIRGVVCRQDLCVVLVYDTKKRQYVIERFCLKQINKFHPLTVLPNELQLNGVSVALHDNLLYAVGGRTGLSGLELSIARVCDLPSGRWSELDDIQTERSSCSCVIVNNTVVVGGGFPSCNTVEALRVGTREWRRVPSTTNYRPTLTAASNRLVATGGETGQLFINSTYSSVVELFDDRTTKWRPLPNMTHARYCHGAYSRDNGELVTAGGSGVNSLESLSLH